MEKNVVQKDACTLMFTEALLAIAKARKQTECPSTDEWGKRMWCVCSLEYFSVKKKKKKKKKNNKIMPFAAMWIDLESIILSEVSQTEEDKYHMISLICGI